MTRDFTILIVDSDIKNLDDLSAFLSDEGHLIKTAHTPTEAIITVQNSCINLVILEADMNSVKADELIPIIKKIDDRIMIIIMSNDISTELIQRIREAGIFYYVMKPIDKAEIRMAVADAVNIIKKKYGYYL